MKSSTKGLIALLAFLAIVIVVVVVMFVATRAENVKSGDFYDKLFEGNIDGNTLEIANDTLSYKSEGHNCVTILYAESGYAEVFAEYDAAIGEAQRLEAEVEERRAAEEDAEEAPPEEGESGGTDVTDPELPGMSEDEAEEV